MVDPQAQKLLDAQAKLNLPDVSELTPERAREGYRAFRPPKGPEMDSEDRTLALEHGDVAVRVYRPSARRDLPCLVWLHGGGFVLGDLDGHDALCRQLAADSGCAVLSVDYRLAPEHPFPAGLDDTVAVLRHIARGEHGLGIDHTRLAVGGDSAGGNLATVAAAEVTRDQSVQLKLQLLAYPVTDLRSLDSASYARFAEGHYLTRRAMQWFREHYLSGTQSADDPRVSPLASKQLAGLPAAHVITAECDVLCDEGERYAAALRQAGVETSSQRYAGAIHAFMGFYTYMQVGRDAVADAAAIVRKHLQP